MSDQGFDHMIIDAGGDDVVILSGNITPADAQAEVRRINDERRGRLEGAPDFLKKMHRAWSLGQHMHFVRSVRGLNIYLDAPGRTEAVRAERSLGAGEDEIDTFIQFCDSGLIYGMHYSEVEPDGEPGSTHICDLQRITVSEFRAARANGWR